MIRYFSSSLQLEAVTLIIIRVGAAAALGDPTGGAASASFL